MKNDRYNLERFLKMQLYDYEIALSEIKSGRKTSHWIWYIFPQIDGLGRSSMAKYYSISSLDEAKEYMAHPVLGARLVEISQALLSLPTDDPRAVMGFPDDMKLCSSMTLFSLVSENEVFEKVLSKYFGGKRDKRTLEILGYNR